MATEKQKRHRSPAYPYYSLKECFGFLEKLYSEDSFAAVPKDIALRHMGFDPTKNSANRAYSALTGFGLLNEKGSGQDKNVEFSDSAQRVKRLGTNNSESVKRLRSAAMKYKIIKTMIEKWPRGLPSDEVIKTTLVMDLSFNERAANRFISVFRETYTFAKFGDSDAISEEIADTASESNDDGDDMNELPLPNPDILEIPVLLLGGGKAVIKVPKPLSNQDFERIKNALDFNKPILVSSTDSLEGVDNNG